MGNFDFYIQTFIFTFFLPTLTICLILRWYFDLKLLKVKTWVEAKFLKWVHGKLENEKKLLFGKIDRVRGGNDFDRNSNKSVLNILEIGVGSGRNFRFYPKKSLITCLEPNPYQEKYVREHIKLENKKLRLKRFVKGFAEKMTSIESNQFDIVICTLTLCTVRKPEAALEEIRRVLKPGGKFFFLEHVAGSRGSFTRWIQNRLQRPWSSMSGGCCLNRETWTYFDNSDFSQVNYQYSLTASIFFAFVRPWMFGVAIK